MRTLVLLGVLLLGGCAGSRPAGDALRPAAERQAELRRLIAALDTVQGEFREVGDMAWALVGGSNPLAAIAKADTAAVPLLAACIADTTVSRVRVAERSATPVRVGVLCLEAMIYTDWYQERNSSDRWPKGFRDSTALFYDATPAQLQRVHRLWQQYLAAHGLSALVLPNQGLLLTRAPSHGE